MSDGTHIQWTDATYNPVTGCTRASEGCKSANRGNHWRGGRTVTSAGYVLLFRPEHVGADVRGYVYEHRLVMEGVLGRPLAENERVRHRDNDPANNDPCNLRLVTLRDHGERALCACGCGSDFARYDASGRPRQFISGHNIPAGRPRLPVVQPAPLRRPRSELGAGLDSELKSELSEAFGGLCAYGCGRRASAWDHVVPWSLGGSFVHVGNAVPACRRCNSAKRANADVWPWIERGWNANPEAWDQVATDAWLFGILEHHLGEMEPANG